MEQIQITFTLKEGQTKEELIETLVVLSFQENMSHLENLVKEIDDGDTIHTDL